MAVTSTANSSLGGFQKFNLAGATLSGAFPTSFRYLVVGGGGSSSSSPQAYGRVGGGAGGYSDSDSSSPIVKNLNSSFTVTVGAGAAQNNTGQTSGSSFDSVTSSGGRAGTQGSPFGNTGGGPTGQANLNAGGGGGAGANGSSGNGNSGGGAGGIGLESSITGEAVYYAGGGGGGGSNYYGGMPGQPGPAGLGGGGQGGSGGGSGAAGEANTGGGGGGAGGSNSGTKNSGAGGSGVVILRYNSKVNLSIGVGLTSSTEIDGEDKVTTFTAGTDTVTVA